MIVNYFNYDRDGLVGLFYSSWGMAKTDETSGRVCPKCLASEKYTLNYLKNELSCRLFMAVITIYLK